MKPWYLRTDALPLLAQLRADPPTVEHHTKIYGRSREEWTSFDGPVADALRDVLTATINQADKAGIELDRDDIRAGADDVIAALLGTWLPGTHYRSDEPRLADIRQRIDAALAQA